MKHKKILIKVRKRTDDPKAVRVSMGWDRDNAGYVIYRGGLKEVKHAFDLLHRVIDSLEEEARLDERDQLKN